MKTIQLNLYPLSELEGGARDKAIESYRYINVEGHDWWEHIFEDFVAICAKIGLTVKPQDVHFRGFYSQGDGSNFKGTIDLTLIFEDVRPHNWREEQERTGIILPAHNIDDKIIALIEYSVLDVDAIVTHPAAYYVTAEISPDMSFDPEKYPNISAELDKLEKWLIELAKTLNRYLYKTLSDTYDFKTSDEEVANTIEANECWFTADGEKANRLEGLNFQQSLKAMP